MAAYRSGPARLFCVLLTAVCMLLAGCEGGNWLSFNIVLDLGLDGETGLLSAFASGSTGTPSGSGSNLDPPTPIQVGDPLGGTTGGTSVVD